MTSAEKAGWRRVEKLARWMARGKPVAARDFAKAIPLRNRFAIGVVAIDSVAAELVLGEDRTAAALVLDCLARIDRCPKILDGISIGEFVVTTLEKRANLISA